MLTKQNFFKLIILALFLLFFLQSCFVVHIASIKDSQPESSKDYNKYLSQIGYDTSFSYKISKDYRDSISHAKYALNLHKVEYGGKASVMQIRMYDNKGNLVAGYEQCFGEIRRTKVLETFPMKLLDKKIVNTKLKLKSDLNWINTTESVKQQIVEQSQKHEYTAIVFYSMWAGWYSKHPLKAFHSYVSKHGKDRTFIILVNGSPE